jgi:hypothetical protein
VMSYTTRRSGYDINSLTGDWLRYTSILQVILAQARHP